MQLTIRVSLLFAIGLTWCFVHTPAAAQQAPLHKAAAAGDRELVARLLAEGADVNARDKSVSWATSLHVAAAKNHREVAELLLAHGAEVNAKDGNGLTPLHVAADRTSADVLKLLLANGAEVNVQVTNTIQFPLIGILGSIEVRSGVTPLHFAAFRGGTEAARQLVAKGAEVNAGNSDGLTPLHMAVEWNQKEMVALLLASGADVNARTKFDWITPLHDAASRGYKEVAELLLAKGAQVNAKKWGGATPLHAAALSDHTPEPVRAVYAGFFAAQDTGKMAVAELLIANGADVNAKDGRGKTPWKLATSQAMKTLLRKYGAQ